MNDISTKFLVDVDGFEGPLDLLLELARSQKVDLSKISMLALAEQFVEFVHDAHQHDIELSGEYLVMACWLAYLKSQLLLPKQDIEQDDLNAHDMAEMMRFKLRRLQFMRSLADKIDVLDRVGRDVFCASKQALHDNEKIHISFETDLYELLSVYSLLRTKKSRERVAFAVREVVTLEEARHILEKYLGELGAKWLPLDVILSTLTLSGEKKRSGRASLFCASLEMVRLGQCELRQTHAFDTIDIRGKGA